MGLLEAPHWPTLLLAVAVTVVLFIVAIAIARST